jgi:hypothetical protein
MQTMTLVGAAREFAVTAPLGTMHQAFGLWPAAGAEIRLQSFQLPLVKAS